MRYFVFDSFVENGTGFEKNALISIIELLTEEWQSPRTEDDGIASKNDTQETDAVQSKSLADNGMNISSDVKNRSCPLTVHDDFNASQRNSRAGPSYE